MVGTLQKDLAAKLGDDAAAAALHATNPQRMAHARSKSMASCVNDGKLSAIGAATSLKHTDSSDLPSFSSSSLRLSSASVVAASLANANQRQSDSLKHALVDSASMAAMRATDHKTLPSWKPGLSSAGSRAAILAHRDTKDPNSRIHKPSRSVSSAAELAMRRSISPKTPQGPASDETKKALLAATGAMRSISRRRSESTPLPINYALDSATLAISPSRAKTSYSSRSTSDGAQFSFIDASHIYQIAQHNVNKDMYGSNPPVAIELEEKKKQDTLRAAAVSMARRMYAAQQELIEEATGAKQAAGNLQGTGQLHRRRNSDDSLSMTRPTASTLGYVNLEEAARKLAAEKLAKLNSEPMSYHNYYGQPEPLRSRKLSIKGRMRRRASSEGEMIDPDMEQSRKIRSQMSLFQDKLAQVDAQKRQKDREALMAAAQRNVTARIQGMDQKIWSETGKPSPSMVAEWETAAKLRAEKDSVARMANHGKVHIGGGHYVDPDMLHSIAESRVKPTLDEISDRVAKQKALAEEKRLDQEQKKREAALESERAAALKAEEKQTKHAERAEAKAVRKSKREQQKDGAQKPNRKRAASAPTAGLDSRPTPSIVEPPKSSGQNEVVPAKNSQRPIEEHDQHVTQQKGLVDSAKSNQQANIDTSQKSSPQTKMKSWLKGLGTLPWKEKGSKQEENAPPLSRNGEVEEENQSTPGVIFRNRLKLRRLSRARRDQSVDTEPSKDEMNVNEVIGMTAPSAREVAIAGRVPATRYEDEHAVKPTTDSGNKVGESAKDPQRGSTGQKVVQEAKPIKAKDGGRESKFSEEF